MELLALSFCMGIFVAMLISAFSNRLSSLLLYAILPVVLILIWYCWGVFGADIMLGRIVQNTAPFGYTQNGIKEAEVLKVPVPKNLVPDDKADRLAMLGQAGDLYGGINALFAALAFAGVAVATVMQARTLQLARVQQLQQSFEPLFFHLLNLHQQVAAPRFKLRGTLTLKARLGSKTDSDEAGLDFQRVIAIFRRALRMKIGGVPALVDLKQADRLFEWCRIYYGIFYSANQDALGPHFRTLYHVFKLIDTSSFDDVTKVRYANIARSTLGKDQIFLLAVNCLSNHGAEFKPLVEKYGLLKHVDRDAEKPTLDERIAEICFQRGATLRARER